VRRNSAVKVVQKRISIIKHKSVIFILLLCVLLVSLVLCLSSNYWNVGWCSIVGPDYLVFNHCRSMLSRIRLFWNNKITL